MDIVLNEVVSPVNGGVYCSPCRHAMGGVIVSRSGLFEYVSTRATMIARQFGYWGNRKYSANCSVFRQMTANKKLKNTKTRQLLDNSSHHHKKSYKWRNRPKATFWESSIVSPPYPQFQCCSKCVSGGANFCPGNARAQGCPKTNNIEIGGAGETTTEQPGKMELSKWCELSSNNSKKMMSVMVVFRGCVF